MNIWLVTIGEPVPHPNNKLRLHRTGLLSKYISENSTHNVIWWTSDFNHFNKSHIFKEDTIFEVSKNYKLIALHGCGYKKNISIKRIIDHKQISKKFITYSKNEYKPDIIIVSFPTLDLANASIKLGKLYNIPVLIDYRDMWPEVFVNLMPDFFKKSLKLFLYPLFNKTKRVFIQSTGIISITNSFLDLALKKINRKRNVNDEIFPLAYLNNQFTQSELIDSHLFWNKYLNRQDSLKIAFVGTIGYQFDLDTIIDAVKILNQDNINNFEIILCGSGDKLESLVQKSKNLKNIIFPGYINAAQIHSLLSIVDLGLCPYNINQAFMSSIPGKAIEYFSAGLPILTTLKDGELGTILNHYNIGFFYKYKDPKSLALVLKKLINEKNILNKNKDKILKLFKTNYEANAIFKKYLSHIENVANNYQR